MCEVPQVGGVEGSSVLRLSLGGTLPWGVSCQPPGPLYFFSPHHGTISIHSNCPFAQLFLPLASKLLECRNYYFICGVSLHILVGVSDSNRHSPEEGQLLHWLCPKII